MKKSEKRNLIKSIKQEKRDLELLIEKRNKFPTLSHVWCMLQEEVKKKSHSIHYLEDSLK